MKIYYVMDVMCGWCYAFSDVITKINEEFKDQVDFSIVPAGMWLNENIKKITPNFSDFIRENNIRITEISGKEFGEDFYLMLKDRDTVLDSLPGSKAINIINKIDNKASFKYLKALQKEFFVNGKNMNDLNVYSKIAEEFGIDGENFKKQFSSKKLIDETFKQFNFAKELGVRSYPSLVLVINEEPSLISSGYLPFEEVKARINKAIKLSK